MNTPTFREIAARAKAALGVESDTALAEALGMTPRGYWATKTRGKFPTEKLYALQSKRPDLGIDAHLILHGDASKKPEHSPTAMLTRWSLVEQPSWGVTAQELKLLATELTKLHQDFGLLDSEVMGTEILANRLQAITCDAWSLVIKADAGVMP